MAYPKKIIVKETISELKKLLKTAKPLISPRIHMLIGIKQYEETGISKLALAELIGVNHNSIQTWRAMYESGGIKKLTSHNKRGFKPSVFSQEQHLIIENILKNPKNGLRGYKELQTWLLQEFNKEYKYNTLLKYCIRHFDTSIK